MINFFNRIKWRGILINHTILHVCHPMLFQCCLDKDIFKLKYYNANSHKQASRDIDPLRHLIRFILAKTSLVSCSGVPSRSTILNHFPLHWNIKPPNKLSPLSFTAAAGGCTKDAFAAVDHFFDASPWKLDPANISPAPTRRRRRRLHNGKLPRSLSFFAAAAGWFTFL